MHSHNYFVYLLRCADGTYYTGVSNDVERRLEEHQSGHDPKAYTYKRRPLELIFFECFPQIEAAIEFEKQVKGWSRKKKEALIRSDWDAMKELARCANGSTYLRLRTGEAAED